MDWVVIIKPLEENYEIIELRPTTIESSLYPLDDEWVIAALDKQSPYRRATTSYEGNLFEECVMSSIISESAWARMCALNAERIRAMQWMEESKSGKDLEFLLYKLDNCTPVDIANAYYRDDIISCQTVVKRFFACGKYLVCLTGTSDLMSKDYSLRDIKYYGNYFWEKNNVEYEVITVDNAYNSRLRKKTQRYTYPYLLNTTWMEKTKFYYDVYWKSKSASSKNNPDNHIKREVIECEVDLKKAEEKVIWDIIKYFMLCNASWTKPWDAVPFSSSLPY